MRFALALLALLGVLLAGCGDGTIKEEVIKEGEGKQGRQVGGAAEPRGANE